MIDELIPQIKNVAPLCPKPNRIILWWRWLLSALKGEAPLFSLMIRTLEISKKGINIIAGIIAMLIPKDWFAVMAWYNSIDKIMIKNPTISEPVSPIKILAGLKLKKRNPSNEPARQNDSVANSNFPTIRNNTPNDVYVIWSADSNLD